MPSLTLSHLGALKRSVPSASLIRTAKITRLNQMKSVAITESCFSCHDNEKNFSFDYREYQSTKGPGDKVGVGYN